MRNAVRASPECEHTVWWLLLCRAVERAVVTKLAAMGGEEMPKPTVRWTVKSDVIDYYTANQMRELFARGVAAGMAAERARCMEAMRMALEVLRRVDVAEYAPVDEAITALEAQIGRGR